MTPIAFLLLLVAGTNSATAQQTPPKSGAQGTNPYLERLKSPDAGTRARAARELGKSGDSSVVPVLAGAARDQDARVRREVVLALALIRQPGGIDPLAAATHDSDASVRQLAVQGLVGYYTGQAPETGLTGFVKKNVQRAKSHYSPEETQIDPGVKVDPRVVAALEECLASTGSPQAAREAAKGLGILSAPDAVPALVKAAHSLDADLAREAMSALAKIKDISAGPQLVDLLDSTSKEVELTAAVTVGILRARQALPKLQTLYEKGPDKKTRTKALEGLAYLGDPVSVPIFVQALWSADKALRISGAEGLGRAADGKALPEVERAASIEKDAGAKLAMEFAITALGKGDYLSAMVGELGSRLHGNIAQSYFVELSRNPQFLPRLYPYLNNQDPAVRKRLSTVLMFTGDKTSIAPLEQLSHDSNTDVASEALRALRAIRTRTGV